jgi:SNF2 family DNA or RNA helicase
MLILDEAHKLRNLYGVEKAPRVAKRLQKALEVRRFRFVRMLTATPIQNRLWDLYSLIDLLTVSRGSLQGWR